MQIKIEIVGNETELRDVLSLLAGQQAAQQVVTHKEVTPVLVKPTPATKKVAEADGDTDATDTTSSEEKTQETKVEKVVKPTVTFEELREMITSKNKTPERKGKALIAEFGFTKLDEVRPRPDLWDEMYAKAKAL